MCRSSEYPEGLGRSTSGERWSDRDVRGWRIETRCPSPCLCKQRSRGYRRKRDGCERRSRFIPIHARASRLARDVRRSSVPPVRRSSKRSCRTAQGGATMTIAPREVWDTNILICRSMLHRTCSGGHLTRPDQRVGRKVGAKKFVH